MIPVRLILLLCCLASCRAQFKDYLDDNDGSNCGEEQFKCDNGDCVLVTEICDGKNDCTDGSDELFCLEKIPVQCNETIHFKCEHSNMCIPLTSLCDTVNDCEDGSDEAHCIAEEKEAEDTDLSKCKGFICGTEKKCISKFWTCDGVYDCKDKSDENIVAYCRFLRHSDAYYYGHRCYVGNEPRLSRGELYHKCLDKSFCLPPQHMCDGVKDCKDGSDEGPFCENWKTMCTDTTCAGNKSEVGCFPHRDGPQCLCLSQVEELNYNKTTHSCDPIHPCSRLVPLACSQICTPVDDNKGISHKCSCAEGYKLDDKLKYMCDVDGYSKPLIFLTTRSTIRYGPASNADIHTFVIQRIKTAHGVAFDGEYIYWVQIEEGHQAILRAKPNDFESTKQVIISIGLEDPGDIAVDFFGNQIYFTDVPRGVIFVCTKQAEYCATVKAKTVHPRYVTLDSKNGKMYWADKHSRPVIMTAKMDGSDSEVLVDYLMHFPTGLTLDGPSDRLYFIDGDIMVVRLSDRTVYALYRRIKFHPYALAVFENTIFLSDMIHTGLEEMSKIFPNNNPSILFFDEPIYGMHIYHDVLKINHFNPCHNSKCSHFCFLTSNKTHVCGCPDDMTLTDGSICIHTVNQRPRYLIIGGGHSFTRIDYNKLSNPHLTSTNLNIKRVQAMAYDSKRDTMYLFDGGRKKIVGIKMDDYDKSGKTFDLVKQVTNIIDMHYDYVTDTLYFLDAARSVIEVVSLESGNRAPVYRFERYEMPVSFCIAHDYGTMLVAIMETEEHDTIHIDSIGLDGKNRKHLITSGLVGPRVKIRYSQLRRNEVYISDETRGNIEIIHPEGTGRRIFRKAKTAIADMSVSERLIFWTDKHTERLFWADVHVDQKIRRMELPSFNSDVHLHLLVTYPPPDESSPLMQHPCFTNNHTCSSICVQTSHPSPYHAAGRLDLEYTCLCPINEKLVKGKCVAPVDCKNKYYCHLSNTCFSRSQLCDGKKDCPKGEDEMGCDAPMVNGKKTCNVHEKQCGDECILLNDICNDTSVVGCEGTLYKCRNSGLCIERSQVCNGHNNCPEGDDELHEMCNVNQCLPTEFMCTSIGNCILNTFRCDGDADCFDNSDELNCEKKTCGTDMFQCLNGECIEDSQRCDGHDDCVDFSDEDGCHIPVKHTEVRRRCQLGETPCEFNPNICMRDISRCDGKMDCPGGTDEMDCNMRCRLRFECKTKGQCINRLSLCDGKQDCEDGSDEDIATCDDRCRRGFHCSSFKKCIEWGNVCDGTVDCDDGGDEGGLCSRACVNNTCSNECQVTPHGPHCMCPKGYKADGDKCVDVDECDSEIGLCSQGCQNVPGSFACHCYHGYTLRSDGRRCKATKGEAHFLYANGNTIKSLSFGGEIKVLYSNDKIDNITGIDYNYYNDKMYIVTEQGKLMEVNGTQDYVSITNVGKPSKLAVDWVTGNVYFFDNTTDDKSMRVCNFEIKRCAKLSFTIKPTEDVCGIITDPSHRKLYTCVYDGKEFHKIWVSSLDGYGRTFLKDISKYPSLALDSHANVLYFTDSDFMVRASLLPGQTSKFVAVKNIRPMMGMVLFEDFIFYYAPRVGKFSACQNFGSHYCAYIYSLLQFDDPVTAWALKHQSVQRDDLTNDCVGFVCAGVCVLDDDGPVCLCPSGDKYNQDETCTSDHGEVAQFETWSHVPERDHTLTYVLVTVFLTLLGTFVAYFYYYHYYQANAARNAPSMPVSFHNVGADEGEPSTVQIDVPGGRRAAVNPFQILQDFFNQSIRRRRPIGTAGLSVDVPTSAEEEPIVASSSHTSTDESNSDEATKTTLAKSETKASTSDSEIETAFRTYRLQP